jgi:hypothetical protein
VVDGDLGARPPQLLRRWITAPGGVETRDTYRYLARGLARIGSPDSLDTLDRLAHPTHGSRCVYLIESCWLFILGPCRPPRYWPSLERDQTS